MEGCLETGFFRESRLKAKRNGVVVRSSEMEMEEREKWK